jgi:hypothetical protein
MVITASNRDQYLRRKNRFYIAGWVASEFGEKPQERPKNYKYPKLYADYMEGYGEQLRNVSMEAQERPS